MATHGYKVVDWNVDTNDWKHPLDSETNLEAYRDAIQDPAARNESFISLQHDALQGTAQDFSQSSRLSVFLAKGSTLRRLGDTTDWKVSNHL